MTSCLYDYAMGKYRSDFARTHSRALLCVVPESPSRIDRNAGLGHSVPEQERGEAVAPTKLEGYKVFEFLGDARLYVHTSTAIRGNERRHLD